MQRLQNSAPSNQVIVCPWCGTVYQQYQPNCSNCGGVLPHRDATSAGDPPPPPPRQLPKEFARRVRRAHQFQFLFGGIFAAVGTILGGSFLLIGLVKSAPIVFPILGIVFLLVFGGIGYGVLFAGMQGSRAKLKALSEGASALGTIDDIFLDNSIEMNGRLPWKVMYSFTANGGRQTGGQHLWQPDYSLEPGFPVYVVYLPEDPGNNSIYPPLA